MVASRFLFNIGKISSVLLAATFFVTAFSASPAEATVNANITGVQESISASKQLIARKPRKKVIKAKRRTTVIKKKTTIISPSATTVIKETTVITPTTTESAPPPPRVEDRPVQPQSQVESDAPVSQQDLDRLRGLVDSYRTELEGIDGRIKAVDAKAAKAGGSFSTTTKLAGEVIIGVNAYSGANVAGKPVNGATLTDRVRLNFDTSFTGKDRLRTRLQSRNNPTFGSSVTGTNMTRLGFDGDEGNSTSVSLLQYTTTLGSTKITAETVGSEFNENMYTFNPLLAAAGTGSISRFGRYNPIYRLSGDGAALTLNQKLGDNLDLSVGYAIPTASATTSIATTNTNTGLSTPATSAASPAANSGIFGANNALIAQLAFRPVNGLSVGATYARSSHFDGNNIAGGTGSVAAGTSNGANQPFGSNAATAEHVSFAASYKIGDSAILSGWYGNTTATQRSDTARTASINNYAVSLAFPDFGSKGNTLGLIYGQQPRLNSTSVPGRTADADTSMHLEALYKIKVSDSVDVTPGILLITNPNNVAGATEYVGTIRTTLKF